MEKFNAYFLTVNLLLVLQAAYYRIFLSGQRRFALNRAYILGGAAAALLLPLLRWEILPPALPGPINILYLPVMAIGEAPASAPVPESWTAAEIALVIYGLGVLIAFSSLILRNVKVLHLIWKGRKTKLDGYTFVDTAQGIGPASYFKYIFWPADLGFDAQGAAVALAHERCHSRQLHSLDLLAIEAIKVFCWFNPAVYYLRKALRETHELLADQAALQVAGIDGLKRLVLHQQIGRQPLSMPNFFFSNVKNRIMILSETPKRKALLRYLLALPLAGLVAACTSSATPLSSDHSYIPVDSPMTMASASTDSVFQGNADQSKEDYKGFFNIEDVFVEAQLPLASGEPRKEGLTCLGHVPEILYMDSVMHDDSRPVESLPKLLNREKVIGLIGYPQEAKDKKITGKVVTKLLVDETGHVIRCIFLQEGDPLLRNAVFNNVKELRFKPGLQDGKPAEWWVVMPFSFGLGGC